MSNDGLDLEVAAATGTEDITDEDAKVEDSEDA